MVQKLAIGIVLIVLLSSFVIAIHTPETRYGVEQTSIEQRNILFTENRFGIGYVKPFGGYGFKGASRGSFGFKGEEEGASVLATNAFIPQGRNPGRIGNYYASARGYRIIDKYVELKGVDGAEIVVRPQITGEVQAHARIVSIKPDQLALPEGRVLLRTKDLPPAPGMVYEAWLVDTETGYSLSLGIFQPSGIGRVATLEYKSTVSLEVFDKIIVTVEPFPDDNPGPGTVVLSGDIGGETLRSY